MMFWDEVLIELFEKYTMVFYGRFKCIALLPGSAVLLLQPVQK